MMLVVVLSILFSIYSIVREPSTQTMAVRLVADYLSKELGTEIRIRGFDLSLRKGLVIQDIRVLDRKKLELFAAHEFSLFISKFSWNKKSMEVGKVFIDYGVVQLVTYKGDTVPNIQFFVDYFSSRDTVVKVDTSTKTKWNLSVSRVELKNTRFHLQDENSPPVDRGMDYANLDIKNINLLLTHFVPDGDTLNAEIVRLSADERCGLSVMSMSGKFSVSPAFLKAKDLHLVTNNSNLDVSFEFHYKNWTAYNDFLNEVKIDAKIQPSYLDLYDIGAFAPELYSMKDKFRISGNVKGTVSNFRAKDLRFAFGKNTTFYGNVSANGLPDVEETFVDLNIKEFSTSKSDIETLQLPIESHTLAMPGFLESAGVVKLKGSFTGFYNDFVTNLKVTTDIGNASADLSLKQTKGSKDVFYKGGVKVVNVNVGQLMGAQNTFGRVTFAADLDGKGFAIDEAALKMNIRIDSLEFNKYNYKNIDIKGSLNEKKFNGHLDIADRNLNMDFNGIVDFSDSIPAFDFTADIKHARLAKLNLLVRDSIKDFSTKMKVDFSGKTIDDFDGMVKLDNTLYIEGPDSISMKHLALFTENSGGGNKTYKLACDYMDAEVGGDFRFSQMLPSVISFVENYLASFRMNDSLVKKLDPSGQVMHYRITLHQTDELTRIFLPFLHIDPNTRLEGTYDEKDEQMTLLGQSPDIVVGGNHLVNWHLFAKANSSHLTVRTGCSSLYLGKPDKRDTVIIKLDSLELVSDIRQDTIRYDFTWNSTQGPSEFAGFLDFSKSPAIELKVTKFDLLVDGRNWCISKDNYIVFDTNGINISNFYFSSGIEQFGVDGRISALQTDTLDVLFKDLNVKHADYFLGTSAVDIDGVITGNVKLSNVYNSITVLADVKVDSFAFNKEKLGGALFKMKYNNKENQFDVNAQVLYKGNLGVNIPLSVNGKISLGVAEPRMDFDIILKNLNLRIAEPFVSSFMSGVRGLVSGEIKLSGRLDKPELEGELKLMRTEFKINYLNVGYSLADNVTIDDNSFNLKNITIYDSLGNKAYVNGEITHDHFSDLALDLNIDFDDFSAFSNTYQQNQVFYGNAKAGGTVSITGPVDDLSINVKAESKSGTHVIIPINLTASVDQNDFIIFDDPLADTLIQPNSVQNRFVNKGLSLYISTLVNPDADIEVFLPGQLGNLKASGTGNLTFTMTPSTSFSLLGTYTISKGNFVFALRNLMRLPFTIQEGSRIEWAGDPTDANVYITAVYKTRVPMEGVTSDPAYASKRVPVECVIRLGNKLMNPDVMFGLSMPNADEQTKTVVYSAIDTTNQVELSQQVISILVINQFKATTGGSSTVNMNSAPLTLVTNQLSSIISQLSSNVNVGLNYKAGSSTSGQEFDVAVSTQLLNDRLLIDGVFGMSNESPSSGQQASNIVGDINIEYILTKNRRWRVRAFNRTNTVDNLLNNNAPYTQGIGVSWQRDFNNVAEMFRRKK